MAPRRRRPPAKPAAPKPTPAPVETSVPVDVPVGKTMMVETRGRTKRWGKEFWRSVLENFALASGTIFLLQLAKIQSAISAGDWSTVKKVILAVIFGAVFAFVKALWTALGIPVSVPAPPQNGG